MSLCYIYRSLAIASTIITLAACNKSADESQPQFPAAASSAAASTGNPATSPAGKATVNASSLSKAVLSAATNSDGHCSLDAINGSGNLNGNNPTTVKDGQTFTAGGWVVTSALQSPSKFTLVLQGADSYGFESTTGVSRPDVAKAMNAASAVQSGFNVTANLGTTPTGTYKVQALIKSPNGTELCDMQRQLIISN